MEYMIMEAIEELLNKALELPNGYHCEVYIRNGKLEFSDWLNQNEWTTDNDKPEYIGELRSVTRDEVIELGYENKDIPNNITYEDALGIIGDPLISNLKKENIL